MSFPVSFTFESYWAFVTNVWPLKAVDAAQMLGLTAVGIETL